MRLCGHRSGRWRRPDSHPRCRHRLSNAARHRSDIIDAPGGHRAGVACRHLTAPCRYHPPPHRRRRLPPRHRLRASRPRSRASSTATRSTSRSTAPTTRCATSASTRRRRSTRAGRSAASAQRPAARNNELVEGKTVGLEKDVSETDEFGRLLRYVWLGQAHRDGERDCSSEDGYARPSTYPPDVKYQEMFAGAAARGARAPGRGLWGAVCATPVPRPRRHRRRRLRLLGHDEPVIKGNISSTSGEKIYHVPGERVLRRDRDHESRRASAGSARRRRRSRPAGARSQAS